MCATKSKPGGKANLQQPIASPQWNVSTYKFYMQLNIGCIVRTINSCRLKVSGVKSREEELK